MLTSTFCHIPGIGLKTEYRIWESGVRAWEDYVGRPSNHAKISRQQLADKILRESMGHLAAKAPGYFEKALPSHLHWRLFREFRDDVAYVDIETTGLEMDFAEITTIALYDGKNVRYYVNGENLEAFVDDIFEYKVIVTYNGKCFDIPFIERYFRIKLDHAQIDLRYVLNRLGIKGGLKACERKMGISRDGLDGVDGYFAVLLWADYARNKNIKALETLLSYNIEDTVNLEMLMVLAYNLNIRDIPFFGHLELPMPARPALPFSADSETIHRIRFHGGL